MERNTIIAIALSALVFFTYISVFAPPKQTRLFNNTQTIVNNEVSSTNSTSEKFIPQVSAETTNNIIKTTDYQIKNPKIDFSFTNVGGSLHNLNFLRNNQFPLSDILSINGLDNVTYTGRKIDDRTISLTYQDKNWDITKSFEFKDRNFINVRMEIKNLSEMSILENFSFTAFEIDESKIDISQNSRDFALYEYSVESNNKIFRKGNAIKFSDKNNKNASGDIEWLGFRDHYNVLVVKPEFKTKWYEIKTDSDKQLNVAISPEDRNLGPGESVEYDFSIYAGPQNPWNMKKYHKGFEKIVAFSNFPVIEWIAQGIYRAIPFLHQVFRSWGIAIILISLIIYGITYPLTMKSMMSMRKMQEVQPKITALRERYKNDPQKLNSEMVEIYRREKINPFSGCLPFIIQMPFFMALYQILWRAQYFQGQGFLWIKDLTQPDRLLILPFQLPFLGNELNILPILTGSIMFVQQRITSKSVIVTDEQQVMQQKMMMYVLPVMMTCMFYKFASSWAIYFFVFYILSTLTQWKISKLGKK